MKIYSADMKRFILVPLVLISSIVVAAQSTQPGPAPGDWPLYSRTLAGTRYSPLTDINTTNVAKLAPAWSVRLTQPQPHVVAVEPRPQVRRHLQVAARAPQGTSAPRSSASGAVATTDSTPPAATRKPRQSSWVE